MPASNGCTPIGDGDFAVDAEMGFGHFCAVKNLPLKSLLLPAACGLLLAATPAKADTVARSFGAIGTNLPQLITELDTTVGFATGLTYEAITTSNDDIRFGRYIGDADEFECNYWFSAGSYPDSWAVFAVKYMLDSPWYREGYGYLDGASQGSDNFTLLYSLEFGTPLIVAVLQYSLDHSIGENGSARLLAYAVNTNGLTFQEGVAAIQAIPEPSTVAFAAVALVAGVVGLRRRRR